MQALEPYVVPDEEADAAEDDEQHYRDAHQRVVRIGHQGGKGRLDAHEVEARVAEGGDGVEHGVPYPPPQPELGDEAYGQQHRPRELEDERAEADGAGYFHYAADADRVYALGHYAALAYAHAAAQQSGEERGDGHEAKTAYLDEQEYHHLPEAGPVSRRVHQHEARDARGADRGEERGYKARRPSALRGHRQHEQYRPRRDDGEEAQSNGLDI